VCTITQVVLLAEGAKVLENFQIWRWITRINVLANADRKCEDIFTNLAQLL
jgi:hypothetical protein